MKKLNLKLAERLGYLVGTLIALMLWAVQAIANPTHELITNAPVVGSQLGSQFAHLPSVTPSMLLATFVGAFGSYLAFGEDKKFPPSATSVGHVLLGFGAGLFFTRGSLELMGRINSSHDVVLFVSFLWAVGGYFILRLAVSIANSDKIKDILPRWIARLLGVKE